jgi:hypothetical protein
MPPRVPESEHWGLLGLPLYKDVAPMQVTVFKLAGLLSYGKHHGTLHDIIMLPKI